MKLLGLQGCDKKQRSWNVKGKGYRRDAEGIESTQRSEKGAGGGRNVAGAPIPCGIVAQNLKIVNRNLLLLRYSFERIAKSFKRGEL